VKSLYLVIPRYFENAFKRIPQPWCVGIWVCDISGWVWLLDVTMNGGVTLAFSKYHCLVVL